MSSKDLPIPATEFHNVQVTAIPSIDPETGQTNYSTTFNPESITVTTNDAVLNYQLIPPTPNDVQFKDVKFKQKTSQLSEPSISLSGKIVTFSDANTSKEDISITFHFIDKDNNEFFVDPIVENDPPPT